MLQTVSTSRGGTKVNSIDSEKRVVVTFFTD